MTTTLSKGEYAQFKPLRTEKFSAEIANRIKESIFNGTYNPGDRLPSENEFARMFGGSNVTVRQAIRILEHSGIVFTRQGVDGGIFVAKADTMSVSTYLSDMLRLKRVTLGDLTIARIIFEPDIASLAASMKKEDDLEELEENIRDARVALGRGDYKEARLLNLRFHRTISNITRNPVIVFTLNSVADVLEENISGGQSGEFVGKTIEAHERILEKIRAGDKIAARSEMAKHVRAVHKSLKKRYT